MIRDEYFLQKTSREACVLYEEDFTSKLFSFLKIFSLEKCKILKIFLSRKCKILKIFIAYFCKILIIQCIMNLSLTLTEKQLIR